MTRSGRQQTLASAILERSWERQDEPRDIDRVIDYFGEGRRPRAVRRG